MTSVMDRTGARLLTRTLLALVLLAGPAGSEARAAIAFVKNVGTNGDTIPGTSLAVTLHGNTSAAVGDTVIVTFVTDPSAGAVSCADSGGNSYSLDADVTNGSVTSGVRTVIFSAFVNTALGNQNTITVTHPLATSKAVSVNEFSGVRAAALDQTAGATGNSTTPASGATALTAQPNQLLIGAIGVETKKTESFTAGAGYSALTSSSSGPALGNATDNVTIDPEYRIVAATGSYTADGTLGRQRLWAAAIATYRSTCGDGTLDPGEQCDDGNNLNADCCSASCTIEPAGTVCRPAAGVCDVAETCNGTSPTCPADVFVSAATQCRAAVGECDVAELCPGNGANCPADAKQPSGTACTDDGNPCTADTCDGTNDACQHPAGNAGAVCRASVGVCDVAEMCTGASATCPPDAFQPNGTVCDDGNFCTASDACQDGTCAGDPTLLNGAACDDGNTCTDNDTCAGGTCSGTAAPDSTPCDDGNDCTTTDSCQGGVCTGAAVADSTPCSDGNDCTSADSCQGGVCLGTAVPDSTACDDGNGCTGPDTCQGGTCTGAPVADGTACDDGSDCTAEDSCQAGRCGGTPAASATPCAGDGTVCTADGCDASGRCIHPPDPASTGTVCRAAAGACDAAEACTGTSAYCPADAVQPASTECRAAAGPCDVAEACTGTGPDCPADAFQPATLECRAAAGVCDVAESCDGASAGCPADAFQPATVECRASAGVCDVAETCDGASADCPADAKSTALCRTAAR